MPQIIPGILIGSPGPVGSAGVYIFRGSGDPNARTDFGANAGAGGSIPQASISIGSLFLRTDGPDATHCFYVKTAQPNIWTNK